MSGSGNGLYRSPLTHNPRVVSLDDLNRIRYGTTGVTLQTPPHDATEPAKGLAPLNTAPALPPPDESDDDAENDRDPADRKRHVFSSAEKIAILAALDAPGADQQQVCAKFRVHPSTVYYWRNKLSNQKRGAKPGKRRRVVAEPRARAKFIETERASAPGKKGNPFGGIDDIAATLARVIADANAAAREVEALRVELDRMRSIFGGK